MAVEKEKTRAHNTEQNLILKNRKYLELSGITEVISFNEDKVFLQTIQGVLEIKGQELNMQKLNLDDGNVKIEGLILSLSYSDKTQEKGLLKKIFK
ncbi:MAG: sporulation protein YabP [Halanaerobiales bacterium]